MTKNPCSALEYAGAAVTPPESHALCMACGRNNSLGLQFRAWGDSVTAIVPANLQWQGYAGMVHGGMISTLLDAAMTHCLFHHEIEAMTASLKIRFLEPVACVGLLKLKATLLGKKRHVYLLNAELSIGDRILAQAQAHFICAQNQERRRLL